MQAIFPLSLSLHMGVKAGGGDERFLAVLLSTSTLFLGTKFMGNFDRVFSHFLLEIYLDTI